MHRGNSDCENETCHGNEEWRVLSLRTLYFSFSQNLQFFSSGGPVCDLGVHAYCILVEKVMQTLATYCSWQLCQVAYNFSRSASLTPVGPPCIALII
jgi:hypothetical protein